MRWLIKHHQNRPLTSKCNIPAKGVRFSPYVSRIGKFGSFKDHISEPKCTEIWSQKHTDFSHIVPTCPMLCPNLTCVLCVQMCELEYQCYSQQSACSSLHDTSLDSVDSLALSDRSETPQVSHTYNYTIYIKPRRQSERKTSIQKNLGTSGQKFFSWIFCLWPVYLSAK